MIKQTLQVKIKKVVNKIYHYESDVDLERPTNQQHGDFSSTIALKLAKTLKKNPMEIAKRIADAFPKNELIKKVEVLKPGFINFWISDSYFLEETQKIAGDKISYPAFHLGKLNKIMVEYAHPNTHKLFHIGHLRNITTGESIIRILETVGNKVVRSNYQGDVGLHIAKCLFKVKSQKSKVKNMTTIHEKIKFLGNAYSEGQQTYENDEKAKQEIIEINKQIYDKDPEIMGLWTETRQWSLDYFDKIYRRVYSKFDRLYFESELHERGREITRDAEKKGILEKSEGALVFKGEKYGLDTRVFINSLGFPTYEGKELALSELEFSEFGRIDKCIHVVTPEQTSFFKVTFKVEELLNKLKFKDKQYHLIYEWVQLKSGKMSSREGNVIEGNWLIDEAKKKIVNLYKCEEGIAEILAVAAIKYSFLKHGVKNAIAFDFDESISLEGNSAPYLIYTYVRCQSVLKKNTLKNNPLTQSDYQNEEIALLRMFYQFPEIVLNAAQNFAPNYIATYLFTLAQTFNLFYQKCPILKAKPDEKQLRILITKATANIIKQGLYLLGIKTVEKM